MAEPVKTEKGLGVAVVCLLIGLASCKSSSNVSFQKAVEMTMESQEQLKRDLGKMDEFNRRIAQQKQTNSTLLQIVESLNRRLGNESSIVRNMGQPISRKEMEIFHSKGGPSTGNFEIRYEYDGVTVTLEKLKSGKELLIDLDVQKDNPKLMLPIKLGMTRDEIKQEIGKPIFDTFSHMIFYRSEKGNGRIATITLEKEKAVQIELHPNDYES